MDVNSLGWIIVIVAAIASAIVGSCNPRQGSFWSKVLDILNYISIFNPSGTVVMRWHEYQRLKKKDVIGTILIEDDEIDVKLTEHRQ